MDPITAVSLVASVVGLLDVSVKVIRGAMEISDKGKLVDAADKEEVAKSIGILRKTIPTVDAPLTEADNDLRVLSTDCKDLGEELLQELAKVQPKSHKTTLGKFFGSFTSSAGYARNKSNIEGLDRRFREKWSLLQAHIQRLSAQDTKDQLKRLVKALQYNTQQLENMQTLCEGVNVKSLAPGAEHQLKALFTIGDEILDEIARHRILESLKFEDMHEGYRRVTKSHGDTMNWVFDFDHTPAAEKFANWLRRKNHKHGQEIFHISGKLGSGKSTLMKKLVDDDRTRGALQDWIGGVDVYLVKFFFWAPGTVLQKSLLGLQRALLHDVLDQCPGLASVLLSDQWKAARSQPWQIQTNNKIRDDDCSRAFQKLMALPSTDSQYHLAIFIDGLDEFESTSDYDYGDMLKHLKTWAASNPESVKICVSSREDPPMFMDAFSAATRLRLHDLTKNDMDHFVSDQLSTIKTCSPDEKDQLAKAIVSKADGVFLWVSLVVRSMIDNARKRAKFAALIKYVHDLKSEMIDLLDRIVADIGYSDQDLTTLYRTVALHEARRFFSMRFDLFGFYLLDECEKGDDFSFSESISDILDITEKTTGEEALKKYRKCEEDGYDNLSRICHDLFQARPTRVEQAGLYQQEEGKIQWAHRSIADYFRRRMETDKAFAKEVKRFNCVAVLSRLAVFRIKWLAYYKGLLQASNSELETKLDQLIANTQTKVVLIRSMHSHQDHPPYKFLTSLTSLVHAKQPGELLTEDLLRNGFTGRELLTSWLSWDIKNHVYEWQAQGWRGLDFESNSVPLPSKERREKQLEAPLPPLLILASHGRYDFPLWKLGQRHDPTALLDVANLSLMAIFDIFGFITHVDRGRAPPEDIPEALSLTNIEMHPGSDGLWGEKQQTLHNRDRPQLLEYILDKHLLAPDTPVAQAQVLIGDHYLLHPDADPSFDFSLWQSFLLLCAWQISNIAELDETSRMRTCTVLRSFLKREPDLSFSIVKIGVPRLRKPEFRAGVDEKPDKPKRTRGSKKLWWRKNGQHPEYVQDVAVHLGNKTQMLVIRMPSPGDNVKEEEFPPEWVLSPRIGVREIIDGLRVDDVEKEDLFRMVDALEASEDLGYESG